MDERRSGGGRLRHATRATWCCAAPSRRWRRAWAASSARRTRRVPCARLVGPDLAVVTPGIRPAGADARRPEARHDACRGDPRRSQPSGGRAADRCCARSAGGGRGDPRGNGRRLSAFFLSSDACARKVEAISGGGGDHAERILDRACRCARSRGLQGLCRGGQASPSTNTGRRCWRAAEPTRRPKGKAWPRNVVIEFASLKAAQDCYHSPEYAAAPRHPPARSRMRRWCLSRGFRTDTAHGIARLTQRQHCIATKHR